MADNTRAIMIISPFPSIRDQMTMHIMDNYVNGVDQILESGFYVDTQDYLGRTPLYEAVFYHRMEIVEFLLRRGAKFHVAAHNGLTPFRLLKKDYPDPVMASLMACAMTGNRSVPINPHKPSEGHVASVPRLPPPSPEYELPPRPEEELPI